MAKLPTYERQATLMQDVGTLQAPNLQEQVRRSKSIQGSLDVISKFAAGEAEREVTKKAQQYTVANPLTTQQLEEAKVTGVNPIEAALNGGMVWNDAVRKLYAQQASNELTNAAYKHYESVYERVKSGELVDEALIRQEIETPLKSWSGVIAQIDPESANAFYNRRISDGNTYYKASLKEVRAKEQERQDLIAEDTMYGQIKQFQLDIQNQEPGVLLSKYINGMAEANSMFANSPRQQQFKNLIESEFSTALYRQIATDITGEYKSYDILAADLEKNKLGKYTEIWRSLKPTQQNKLQAIIEAKYSELETQGKATLKVLTDEGKNIRERLVAGENPDDLKVAYANYEKGSVTLSGVAADAAKQDIALTQATLDMATTYNKLPISKVEADIVRMENNPDKYPQAVVDIAKDYLNKRTAAKKSDFASYTLTQTGTEAGDVTLLLMGGDSDKIKASFKDQFSMISSQPDYQPGVTNLLTKTQTNSIVEFLQSEEGSLSKEQVARNVVKAFGADALSVFKSISPKDPIFAHIGVLSAGDLQANEFVIKDILKGQKLDVNISNSRKKTDIYRDIMNTIGDTNEQDAKSIMAAADAYYVANASPEDIQYFKEDLYKQALDAVVGGSEGMGGFASINNTLTLIDNNIPQSEVEDYIRSATINDFIAASTNEMFTIGGNQLLDPEGRPYSLRDLRNAEFYKVDNGYELRLQGKQFKVLDEATGNVEPLRVDFNVLQAIRQNKKALGPGIIGVDIPLSDDPYFGGFQ